MKFGFLSALALVFIALKLAGHIAWSWWLVTLPLWGISALIIGSLLGLFITGVAIAATTNK